MLPVTHILRRLRSTKVTARVTLASREDIGAVFRMTPYYFHTSRQDKDKLQRIESLQTDIEFIIAEYEKNEGC